MRNITRGGLALALILLAASAGTGTTTAVPQSANAERPSSSAGLMSRNDSSRSAPCSVQSGDR